MFTALLLFLQLLCDHSSEVENRHLNLASSLLTVVCEQFIKLFRPPEAIEYEESETGNL